MSEDDVEVIVSKQRLWRFVNDRIFDLEQRQGEPSRLGEQRWARCECGRADCERMLPVPVDEYLYARDVRTRFLVVPGHEFRQFERIVDTRDGFAVVETFGPAAAIAAAR